MLQLGGTFFGTCTSQGSSTTKVVSDCPGFVLYTGASVYVKFTETNTGALASLMLNVNSTGAKPIKRYGTTNLNTLDAITAGMVCNFVYDGSYWQWVGQMNTDTNIVPSAYCNTVASNATKVAQCTDFVLQDDSYIFITFAQGNTSAGAFTLNINDTGAKQVYLNGRVTGQDNYQFPAGAYILYYDGTVYQMRTDGLLHGTTTGNIVSITNDGSTIYYMYGDGTTASFVVPHTQYTAGSAISISNNQIINTGVRAVGQGTEDGTISVNTGGTTKNVKVKGLGSAAYENTNAFAQAGHTHGNVSNLGYITGNDTVIGNGDALLVADASDEDRLVKTTIEFDGSTSNKFLSQAGTWETVNVAASTTESLHATSANYAATAGYARGAATAVYAASANYATTASNAANAGYAAQAGTAQFAVTAGQAVHAASAAYATSAQKDADGNVITTTYATKDEVNQLLASNDAMIYKGTLGTDGTITNVPTNSYQAGYTYRIITAGTYAGQVCEVGDLLIALNDGPTTGSSVKNADWTVAQGNLDGTVIGPASSASGSFAIFSGTTGKAITPATSKGSTTLPIYIDANGVPQTITSYQGKAASANYAAGAGTAVYAASAGYVTEATHASSAGYAVSAASAGYAASAGDANTANTSQYAGTASWAISSRHASCAGYAATAGYATNAGSTTEAIHAASATYAGTANYAVSAGSATTASDAVHAASANYATTAGHALDNTKLPLAGGTMTGGITLQADTAAYNDKGIIFTNGSRIGEDSSLLGIYGAKSIYIRPNSNTVDSVEGIILDSSSVYPDQNNVENLGKSDRKWNTVYATTFNGNATSSTEAKHSGSADYATSAGSAGYATKANSAAYAVTAGNAINAINAVYASSAGFATNATEAIHAASAAYAVSAASAGFAEDATNAVHAASAGMAAYATTAGRAIYAASAGYVDKANKADSATEAAHAASAGYATFTSSANYATYAATASYAASAGYASTADSSNTSGTASWALDGRHASCAGYATTAGNAKFAGTATEAIHAASAAYAANANTADQAVHAASAAFATNSTNAVHAASAAYAGSAGSAINDSSNRKIIDTYVTKEEFNTKLAATDAMQYKGTLGTGGTITALPATHSQGDSYKVITAGTYAGVKCEVGDLVICLADGTTTDSSHWTVVQSNIDGAVTGPASATDGQVALFSGTSGKVIKAATISKATAVTGVTFNAGSVPTTEDLSVDDITAWTPNAIPTATVSNGVLIFYAGTTASLGYTGRTVKSVKSVGTAPSLSYATANFVSNIA